MIVVLKGLNPYAVTKAKDVSDAVEEHLKAGYIVMADFPNEYVLLGKRNSVRYENIRVYYDGRILIQNERGVYEAKKVG